MNFTENGITKFYPIKVILFHNNSLDMIDKLNAKYGEIPGWRKLSHWRRSLKSGMRSLGNACGSGGKKKEERVKAAARSYVAKSFLLSQKIEQSLPFLPVREVSDLAIMILPEGYHSLLNKHIDLVDRRLLKGEKMFSIFEPYTE